MTVLQSVKSFSKVVIYAHLSERPDHGIDRNGVSQDSTYSARAQALNIENLDDECAAKFTVNWQEG
jgi:hypothetical protein